MPYVCRQLELGRRGFFPETKVQWEGIPIPHPYVYLRILSTVASAEFCAPEEILNSGWSEISACAITAGESVGIGAIITDPKTSLAAFEPAFKASLRAKLGDRAEEVQVSLSARKQPEKDWHR